MKVSVRLPEHLGVRLDAQVREEGSSRSALIVDALEEYLSAPPATPSVELEGQQSLGEVMLGLQVNEDDRAEKVSELRALIDEAETPTVRPVIDSPLCPSCRSDRRDMWLGSPCSDPWHPGRTIGYTPITIDEFEAP